MRMGGGGSLDIHVEPPAGLKLPSQGEANEVEVSWQGPPPNISLEQTAREIACGFAEVGRLFEKAIFAWGLRAADRTYVAGLAGSLSERGFPRAAAQLVVIPPHWRHGQRERQVVDS
jgi:hypothetical protein